MPNYLQKSVLCFVLLLMSGFSVSSAHAKNYNLDVVSGLYDACQNVIQKQRGDPYDDLGYGLCFGYVRGIKNTYDVQRMAAGKRFKGSICFPNNATWLEIIKVHNVWVENNPKTLHQTAWVGMIAAMKDAYGCNISGKAKNNRK